MLKKQPLHMIAPSDDPQVMLSTISVDGLEVMADIGVYDHEIGVPQPLIISTVIHVLWPTDDSIDQAFNYAHIEDYAKELAAERIALIETFAQRLAATCLAHPLAREVEVTVRKPQALSNGMAGVHVVLRKA